MTEIKTAADLVETTNALAVAVDAGDLMPEEAATRRRSWQTSVGRSNSETLVMDLGFPVCAANASTHPLDRGVVTAAAGRIG